MNLYQHSVKTITGLIWYSLHFLEAAAILDLTVIKFKFTKSKFQSIVQNKNKLKTKKHQSKCFDDIRVISLTHIKTQVKEKHKCEN